MARIAGVNLPAQKHVWVGLQSIYGIGRTRSKKVCEVAGVASTTKIRDLSEPEIERLRAEVEQVKADALRERADLENQRKRVARDIEQARKFANEKLLGELL
ncbi:30S ribosomal protein S13, partial [Klebsiella pneumoniae]|uniref:30S ribosomal protein S13 n=1 Tax=Klebsiella pneumoniae TaxID=573 RepID=UPI00358E3EA1